MIGDKKKYDLIFSLGAACSCTQALRSSYLQFCSYPLDWLFGSDFKGRINIFLNNFNNFIEKNDLEYSYEERSIKCRAYHNRINDITFNHDFLKALSFDDAYTQVKKKYERRIARLYENINNSRNILIVYIETPNNSKPLKDNNVLLEALNKLQLKYPDKNINILYFINDLKMGVMKYKEENISSYITKVTGNYKSVNKDALPYEVNMKFFKSYLKYFSLNLPFKTRIIIRLKKYIFSPLIKIISNKNIKIKIRKKYHV